MTKPDTSLKTHVPNQALLPTELGKKTTNTMTNITTPLEKQYNLADYKKAYNPNTAGLKKGYNKKQHKQKILKTVFNITNLVAAAVSITAIITLILLDIPKLSESENRDERFLSMLALMALLPLAFIPIYSIIQDIYMNLFYNKEVEKDYQKNKIIINYDAFRNDFLQNIDPFYDGTGTHLLSRDEIYLMLASARLTTDYSYKKQVNDTTVEITEFVITRNDDEGTLTCKPCNKNITKKTVTVETYN